MDVIMIGKIVGVYREKVVMDSNQKLALRIMNRNPGALRVITELQWFSKWFEMMKWCEQNGFVGSKLWELYKDQYHCSWHATGEWIKEQMAKDFEEKIKFEKDMGRPMRTSLKDWELYE